LFNGHAALQGPSPDSKTQGFNLYIFLQQREFNVFGSKLAKSPQTDTQAKESKINFKSQLKCCEFLSVHGQLAKLGLQMNSSQQQFLNKGKRPQLKIQTPKRIRYLLHYFGQNSNRARVA
jgi:hypothetical protein